MSYSPESDLILRKYTLRLISAVPLITWLILLLTASAWTRPALLTVQVFLLSLPGFILLELIRWKLVPNQGMYHLRDQPKLSLLTQSTWSLQSRGDNRRLWFLFGPLILSTSYLFAILFFQSPRALATKLDGSALPELIYSIVGAWYPAITRQHSNIQALGHMQEAINIRHFMVTALLLSLAWLFVALGPGRPEVVQRWMSQRRPFMIAMYELGIAEVGLMTFSGFGYAAADPRIYLDLRAIIPCGMFVMAGLTLSWGVASTATILDRNS